MKKALIFAAVVLFACGAVFANGSSEKETNVEAVPGEHIKGGEMVISTNQAFNSMFNPHTGGNAVDWGWPCLETLIYQNPGDPTWKMLLADSCIVDKDNNSVTITIKQGVKFHNGDTLDADDVVFSIQSWVDFGRGATIGSPSSVEKLDDYTVRITWPSFSLSFEQWIANCFIFSKTVFEEHGVDWMLTNMVGTGPYKMTEFIPDVSISYERWDGYREPYTEGPAKIKYLYISEDTTALASFLSKDVTFFKTTSAETVAQLKGYGFDPQSMVGGTEFVHYAQPLTLVDNDPWANAEIRRAVYLHGIDWDAYAYALLGDIGYHTDSIGAAGCSYYKEDLEVSSLDREKAKQIISDAGYPNGFNTKIYTAETDIASATILQSELKKLNINAEVEVIDPSVLINIVTGSDKRSGILVYNLGFNTIQMDRFNKFYSYKGMFAGSTNWSDEEKLYYDNAAKAKTQEEENKWLYEYVKQYVQVDSHFWPIANATRKVCYQDNLWVGENYYCGNRGMDPAQFSFVK